MPRYETPPGEIRNKNPKIDKLKDQEPENAGDLYFQSDAEKEPHILVASQNPKEELVTLGNSAHFGTKKQIDKSYIPHEMDDPNLSNQK